MQTVLPLNLRGYVAMFGGCHDSNQDLSVSIQGAKEGLGFRIINQATRDVLDPTTPPHLKT